MLLVFIDYRMAIALVGFIAVVASIIVVFGVRGRSLHQAYGRQAAQVGGELVDTVSNVWAIKAFSSHWRERARLNAAFGEEISALTFRILHGSRDLALALVGTAQEFGVITEMLRIIGQRHDLHDRADAVPVAPQHGLIEFRDVSYSYSDGHKVFEHFTLTIPAGQRLGIARAFLKYAPILILDEATAALDSRSERDVQRALQHLMEGRTVSAVAHRLSTLDGVRPPRAPLGGATTLGGNAGLASPSKV